MIQSWLSEYLMSTINWKVIHVDISVTIECNSTSHNTIDEYTYVTNNAVMKITTATTAMVMIVVVDIPALHGLSRISDYRSAGVHITRIL